MIGIVSYRMNPQTFLLSLLFYTPILEGPKQIRKKKKEMEQLPLPYSPKSEEKITFTMLPFTPVCDYIYILTTAFI